MKLYLNKWSSLFSLVLIFWPILYKDIYYNFFHWHRCNRLRGTIKSSVLFIEKRTFTRHKNESNLIYITRIWLRRTVTELIKKKIQWKTLQTKQQNESIRKKNIMHWYWTVDKKIIIKIAIGRRPTGIISAGIIAVKHCGWRILQT